MHSDGRDRADGGPGPVSVCHSLRACRHRQGRRRHIEVAPIGQPVRLDDVDGLDDPERLSTLPFIANMALREPLLWQFSRGDLEQRTLSMRGSIAIDTTPGVLAAVRAGGGISVLPDFLVADDLAAGRLVHLLSQWHLPSGGIHTVYPAARFRSPKVAAFVEMLIAAEKKARTGADGLQRDDLWSHDARGA